MQTVRAAILAVTVISYTGCGGDTGTNPIDPTDPTVPVATVQVTAPTTVFVVGDRATFTVVVKDAQGRQLTRPVTWESEDDEVATVSAAGVVDALGPGETRIVATSEGKKGHADILVELPRAVVARVDVSPSLAQLEEGETIELTATPRDADGMPVEGKAVRWRPAAESAALVFVTPGGQVTALRPGTAVIEATVEGQTGTATVQATATYPFELVYDGWNGVPGVDNDIYQFDLRQPNAVGHMLTGGRDPTPSPDGSRIAFVGSATGERGIYVINADGTGLLRLTAEPSDGQPAWSPDGSRIAFRRWPSAEDSDIWVMDADGGNAANLTEDQGATNQSSPAWVSLPSGAVRIAYSHATAGRAHIYTMSADGRDIQPVTSGEVFDDQPSWSPDGAWIVFQRNGAGSFGYLFVVSTGGGGERLLRAHRSLFPAWSPDGRMIAFTSRHDGVHQVFTIWWDGSRLAMRTDDPADKENPAWLRRP